MEKHPNDKISFGDIKSTLYNNINAEIPKDVDLFQELPQESIYYHMQNGEKFVFFKVMNFCLCKLNY